MCVILHFVFTLDPTHYFQWSRSHPREGKHIQRLLLHAISGVCGAVVTRRTPYSLAKVHTKHTTMFLYAQLKSPKSLSLPTISKVTLSSHTHTVKLSLWTTNPEHKQRRAELPRTNTHTPAAYTHNSNSHTHDVH